MSVTTEQEDGSDSVGIGALRFAEKASSFQEVSNFLAWILKEIVISELSLDGYKA